MIALGAALGAAPPASVGQWGKGLIKIATFPKLACRFPEQKAPHQEEEKGPGTIGARHSHHAEMR